MYTNQRTKNTHTGQGKMTIKSHSGIVPTVVDYDRILGLRCVNY